MPASEFAAPCDSAWLDLSKGLGCPVGGVLAGSKAFIQEAWRWKHRLGGAMRQSGILAAAGVYALAHNVERMAEDHANARLLAAGLSQIDGVSVDVGAVETNMVIATVQRADLPARQVAKALAERGVLLNALDAHRMRIVTNYHVTSADVEQVLEAFEVVMGDGV